MIGETKYVCKNPAITTTNSSVVHQKCQPIKSIINYSNGNGNNSSVSKELEVANFNKLANTINSSGNGAGTVDCQNNENTNVKFIGFFENKIDEREKYLTAKYPNHQMALIKKRLKVEFWIDEQMKHLFNIKDENKEEYEICADDLVDNLLDMDSDHERKFHILNQLRGAKKNKEDVMKFVDELLGKLRML